MAAFKAGRDRNAECYTDFFFFLVFLDPSRCDPSLPPFSYVFSNRRTKQAVSLFKVGFRPVTHSKWFPAAGSLTISSNLLGLRSPL